MSKNGIRDLVRLLSPPWLATGIAEKLLYAVGLGSDETIEKANQGARAHCPTYGDPSALPLIGNDRVMPQGPNETSVAYAARLKYAADDWRIAGSDRSVLQQIVSYLAPLSPSARIVDDASIWNTYQAGAPLTAPPDHYVGAANWNWDAANNWWRFWLVVYSVAPNAWTAGEGTWGDGDVWGNAAKSWGLSVPASTITGLRTIVGGIQGSQTYGWQRAGSWCRWIVVSLDATLFDPTLSADGVHNPDGTWGTWGKIVGGVQVASRAANARYCDGIY